MRSATSLDNLIKTEILGENNSAFIFHKSKFTENLRNFKSAFTKYYPDVVIGYSYKTNYVPDVCISAHQEGAWAEVVSEMEVDMALSHLKNKSHIIYNGPAKSKYSISQVVSAGGIINIDNNRDVEEIKEILMENPELTANVAFRLNSDYGDDFSRFGQLFETVYEQFQALIHHAQFNIIGFHLHLPHRSLESFVYRLEVLIDALSRFDLHTIKYINIGGGFFGNLALQLKETLGLDCVPSYEDYGELIGGRLFDFFSKKQVASMPTLYLEPGSSVVADSFTFVSKIHSVKYFESRKIIVSFAARHLLSPTNKTVKLPCEIISAQSQFDSSNIENGQFEIVGFTCIESDILGSAMGNFENGVSNLFVEFSNVGSYSIVMGSNFILPEPPIYSIDDDGNIKAIRKRRQVWEVMNQFYCD
jgi:diaminopimelate decarboxylase